jgi:hypothetical protein
MVEQKLPKLTTRVRFPSPAPLDFIKARDIAMPFLFFASTLAPISFVPYSALLIPFRHA